MAGSSKKGSSKGPKSPKNPKSPKSTRSDKTTASKTGPVDLSIEESPKSTRNGKAAAASETESKGTTKSPKLTRKGAAAAAPETGFNNEDYNIRSPERTKLLIKLKSAIDNAPVSPALWACCQLADMDRLQAITKACPEMILAYDESLAFIPLNCESLGF
jgi:hypothetical protein